MNTTKNKKLGFNIFTNQIIYLSAIDIIALVLCIIKPSTIYVDLFVIFLVSSLMIYLSIREIKTKKSRIRELSNSLDSLLKTNLNSLEIPIVVTTSNGKIVWQNNISKHQIADEYIYSSNTLIQNKRKQKDNTQTFIEVGSDKTYNIVTSYIDLPDFECLFMLFIDVSKEKELKNVLEDTKVAIGVIFIDNYEETLQGLDQVQKADIASKIDAQIRKWVAENHGVIAKMDKDKYLTFVEKKYIKAMENANFEILEKVRKITDITKLPITISIGMSYFGDELDDRFMLSNSALDIALGRGGDQAVIKTDKKFDFYGGVDMGLEKTSRVRARTIAQALTDIMEKSDKVYVMGHKNTDIDCVGAAVGIYKIAKSLNKESHIILDTKYNNTTRIVVDKLKTQAEYENIFLTKDDMKKQNFENSLLVIVDTHKKTYLAASEILDEFEKVVVIDHHRRGPEFIDNALITYHEIYSSSSCELVSELLMYLESIKLTTQEAGALYAGILVDTKNFTFKTGVRTFEVAAYLKRVGFDISEVKQIFQNDYGTYMAKMEVIKNAEITNDGKIAISICNNDNNDIALLAAQSADELLSITGIEASFVLCKVNDVVMVSSRSTGDINVQVIMEKMGGGGHLTFAGAQIVGTEIEDVKTELKNIVQEYLGKK